MTAANFWRGRRVLITGHTGFKGAWLSFWLRQQGAEVFGYALDPPTKPNLFQVVGIGALIAGDIRGDIRDPSALKEALNRARPEVVFHLAAQAGSPRYAATLSRGRRGSRRDGGLLDRR